MTACTTLPKIFPLDRKTAAEVVYSFLIEYNVVFRFPPGEVMCKGIYQYTFRASTFRAILEEHH